MSLIYPDDDMQGGISVGGIPVGGMELGGRITAATRKGQAAYLQALHLLKTLHPDKPPRAAYQAMRAQGMTAEQIVASLSGMAVPRAGRRPAMRRAAPRAAPRRHKKTCPTCKGSGFWDDFAHGLVKGVGAVADIAPKVLPFVL